MLVWLTRYLTETASQKPAPVCELKLYCTDICLSWVILLSVLNTPTPTSTTNRTYPCARANSPLITSQSSTSVKSGSTTGRSPKLNSWESLDCIELMLSISSSPDLVAPAAGSTASEPLSELLLAVSSVSSAQWLQKQEKQISYSRCQRVQGTPS